MRSNYKLEGWKNDNIFKPKIRKKYHDFFEFLKKNGAIISETTNIYEYIRFKINGKTGLAYINKFYEISHFNEVCEQHYEKFIKQKLSQIECVQKNKSIINNKHFIEQKIKKMNEEIQNDENYLEFLKERLENLKKRRDELIKNGH